MPMKGTVTRARGSWGPRTRGRCLPALGCALFLFVAPPALWAQSKPTSTTAPEATEPLADPNLVESEEPGERSTKPEYDGIEEILVTAEKRASNIQETPTAITALSGAQLFDRGIYDIESLATQVPNFQYGESFGIARLTIRGIGNEGFTDPSTAFHIDGVYQNNQTAASALTFYDIEQVEVLRGPQGTLWGRNSTAGAINVSTRAPSHEVEIFGDLLRGSFDEWFGRGVVNVPIVPAAAPSARGPWSPPTTARASAPPPRSRGAGRRGRPWSFGRGHDYPMPTPGSD